MSETPIPDPGSPRMRVLLADYAARHHAPVTPEVYRAMAVLLDTQGTADFPGAAAMYCTLMHACAATLVRDLVAAWALERQLAERVN